MRVVTRFSTTQAWRGAYGKTIVFGLLKREGCVYTEIIPDAYKVTLHAIIRGKASIDSVIHTDGWRGYDGLADIGFDEHFRVNYSNNGFSRGKHHVNGIEPFCGSVKTARSGADFAPGDYEAMRKKPEQTDVLILSHGTRHDDYWNANNVTFQNLIDLFTEIGITRLTLPEVWALGSEVEFYGDMGQDNLKAYSASKRAFAHKARNYYRSNALIYRHIVP